MMKWLCRTALAAGCVLALAYASASAAQDLPAAEFRATTLTLSAEGEVHARPDLATIDVGAVSEAATAAEALARNAARMGAVIAALHGQGVADADIQTSQLDLQPQYLDDGKSPRRLTGYRASNTVTVRLHVLTQVGPVIDALVAAGADQVNGVGFALADPQPAEDEARRQAVKALQARAELYAAAAGYRIQRLVRLSESGGYAPAPMMAQVMVTARRRAVTPVAAGELTVRADVSGEYELVR